MRASRTTADEPLSVADLALFALCLALASALFVGTIQQRIYGHDGAFLVDQYHGRTLPGDESNSALWSTAAALARRLAPDAAPSFGPALVSAVPAAIGVACAFLVARGLGATRGRALVATALLAFAPAVWFFATIVEIHGLHLGAVGIAACATLFAPWRRPALALAITALAVTLLFPTHMTGILLGPGWVLLVQASRARVAAPFRTRTLLLVVGPVLLAAMLASVAVAASTIAGEPRLLPTLPQRSIESVQTRFQLAMAWKGFVRPLFLLLPLAIVGLLSRATDARGTPWTRATVVVAAGVPAAFLLWQSIHERGAYLVGLAPFLVAAAAHGSAELASLRERALAGLLVALQCVAGLGEIARWGEVRPIEERARFVARRLPEGGALLSFDDSAPAIGIWHPSVAEVQLETELGAALAREEEPRDFARRLCDRIASALADGGAVALDLSYRRIYEVPPNPSLLARWEPFVLAFESELCGRFATEHFAQGDWPMLRVRPRAGGGG